MPVAALSKFLPTVQCSAAATQLFPNRLTRSPATLEKIRLPVNSSDSSFYDYSVSKINIILQSTAFSEAKIVIWGRREYVGRVGAGYSIIYVREWSGVWHPGPAHMFALLQLLLHFRSALAPANMGNILSFLFPDDKPAIKAEPKVSLIFTQLSSMLLDEFEMSDNHQI